MLVSITFDGTSKEIADLVGEVQDRRRQICDVDKLMESAVEVNATLKALRLTGHLEDLKDEPYTQSQTPVTSFRVAVDRDYTPKDGGERQADLQNPRILV